MSTVEIVKVVAEVGSIGVLVLILVLLAKLGHRVIGLGRDLVKALPGIAAAFGRLESAAADAARESKAAAESAARAAEAATAAKRAAEAHSTGLRDIWRTLRERQHSSPHVEPAPTSRPSAVPALHGGGQ